MSRYAADTAVSPERSRAEIEKVLARYGADAFSYAYDDGRAAIAFRMRGRMVKLMIPFPSEGELRLTPTGLRRSAAQVRQARDKELRRRWRAMALVVKAKLEAVESGIVTFEDEFLPHIVLPDGSTVGDWMQPQVERAYETGQMPSLMPFASGRELASGD